MSRMEDLVNATKLNELLHRKEKESCCKRTITTILAIIGAVAAVAAIAYAMYRYLTPDYEEDFEEEYDDDFDDLFFEDEDEPLHKDVEEADKATEEE